MKFANCLGCGAPLVELVCPYCGTDYSNAFNLEMAKNRPAVPEYTSMGLQPIWMSASSDAYSVMTTDCSYTPQHVMPSWWR
jgi:hypothetical protein